MKNLTSLALAVRKNAYAPYSKFKVGAALLAKNGKVFVGANVENASYGLAICAERSALASAVSAGVKDFSEIAIATSSDILTPPCGACRQVLAEFNPNLKIILTNTKGKVRTTTLKRLLPEAFTPKNLEK